MNLRAHHLVVSLFIGAIVLGSLAWLTVAPPAAQAACPTGSGVAVTYPSTTAAGPLSNIVVLKAQSTPSTATGLSFMLLTPVQQSIGEASQSGASWNLSWDTRNQPNGSFQLMAIAHFGSATSLDCASAVVPLYINNAPTQSPTLSATINPNTWQGPLGASAPFNVDALYTDQYGRHSHVSPASVNWHSNLGTVDPVGGVSTVFTGRTVGAGTLIADVFYNGLGAPGTTQIKVLPPGSTVAPTPTPNTTGTNATPKPSPGTEHSGSNATPGPTPAPVSAADATRLAAMPTIFRPAAPTNSDPVVNIPTLSCLEKAVGAVRFSEISGGKSQPTAAERKLAAACFTGPEQIPAVLAPVSPSHLTELASTTNVVSLSSVKNRTTTSKDGKKVNGLLISGTGAPNSDIFLYVFSDPLVLRAQTDSHGAWSYVLENPLKAGKHEVYAVAEKDAGNFVRTSAVPISIAAAAPGTQDGSLVVERRWSTAQIGFAGAAAVMILAALGVLFTILRRRRRISTNLAPAIAGATAAPATPAATLIQPSPSGKPTVVSEPQEKGVGGEDKFSAPAGAGSVAVPVKEEDSVRRPAENLSSPQQTTSTPAEAPKNDPQA